MRGYRAWRREAICLDKKDLFDKKPKEAKQLCKGCPVASECFQYAVVYNERGVWGGTSYQERKNIIKRNPEFRDYLIQEARHLGLYETRFSIASYIESLHAARQFRIRTVEPPPAEPEQLLTKFAELSAGWNSLLVS